MIFCVSFLYAARRMTAAFAWVYCFLSMLVSGWVGFAFSLHLADSNHHCWSMCDYKQLWFFVCHHSRMTGRSASLHSTYINGQTSLSCIYFQDSCFPFLFFFGFFSFLGFTYTSHGMHGTGEVVIEDTRRVYQTPNEVDDALTTPLFVFLIIHWSLLFFGFKLYFGYGNGWIRFLSLGKNRHDQTLSRQGIIWYVLLFPHHVFGSRRSTRAKHRVPSSRWACPKTATPCFTTGLDTITELLEISHWNFTFLSLYSLLNVPCFLL